MKHTLILRNQTLIDWAICILQKIPTEPIHECVIRPYKSKRSQSQNNLYWKWLDIARLHIADSTGSFFSAEELHEWFKAKFLPARLIEIGGETKPVRRTTTTLNTKEMTEYLNQIEMYCADSLHLFLPRPGEENDES